MLKACKMKHAKLANKPVT